MPARYKAVAVCSKWGTNKESRVTLIGTITEIRDMVKVLPGFIRIEKFERL